MSGGTLRLVLGDQLSRGLSALAGLEPGRDVVVMFEVGEETGYVPHHPQKIALVLSAMRHFAAELAAEGIAVDYVRLDDPANRHSLGAELARALARHRPARLVMTEPGEWRVWEAMRRWGADFGLETEIRPDDRFFCSREDFAALRRAGRTGRMEYFYREMRKRTGYLMAQGAPVGGQWNLDRENRKALPKGLAPPPRRRFEPDALTREVLDLVGARFAGNFGALEPFGWAVDRAGARAALAHFLADCLPGFGDYQDAMKSGEDFLFHALLSPYLNLGLLTPAEVCDAAEAEYHAGRAPLNAVEGFIRQILGWREFVRGIYWTEMPDYAETNALGATRPLPGFFWTGRSGMACLDAVIGATARHGYAHHIQRLMVTGNFALLAGIAPAEIAHWYLAVYVDAFEWVELPNVQGMITHADGGRLGSKPYAASGAYINRMSDYCRGCRHDVGARLGPGACPFNALYWNFLITHEARFRANPRMAPIYRGLGRFSAEERAAITAQAEGFLAGL